MVANKAVMDAIDPLDDQHLEVVISDFLEERKLVGEFLVWLEKWKSNH